jgi:hypothetical protein
VSHVRLFDEKSQGQNSGTLLSVGKYGVPSRYAVIRQVLQNENPQRLAEADQD